MGARERRAGPARRGAGRPPHPGQSLQPPTRGGGGGSGGRAPEAVPGGWASWEWHGRVPGEARGPAGPPPARARPPAPRVPALGHARRAGGAHGAAWKRPRRPRDSEPAWGPSLSSHPGPGAAPGAESVRSLGVLEVARVRKLATARGVAVESRRAAGLSHVPSLTALCSSRSSGPACLASAHSGSSYPQTSRGVLPCLQFAPSSRLCLVCLFWTPRALLPGSSVSPIASGLPKSLYFVEGFCMSVYNAPSPHLSQISDRA